MSKYKIEKKQLKQDIIDGLSEKEIAAKYKCSPGLIEYYKKVWNFKSKDLRPHDPFRRRKFITHCSFCKKSSKKTKCANCACLVRYHVLKVAIIKFFGGKCTNCGYSQCMNALDFHHINQSDKKSEITTLIREKSNLQTIVEEIYNKCIILCSNCHRELHANDSKVSQKIFQDEIYAHIERNKLFDKINQCVKKIIEFSPLQQY